jgi:hypothetical protein
MRKTRTVEATDAPKPKGLGGDAIVTVSLSMDGSAQMMTFRLVQFVGNTLARQRSGKELTDKLAEVLQQTFGGQVHVE